MQLNDSHIRPLALSRDLDQVADLIEGCFPIHLDRDGQTYIQEMRKAAREMRLFGWLSSLSELGRDKVPGFVWEEDGRLVGNLSLIPFKNQGRDIALIANVAVDPKYRRRGIARALTEHALGYLRRKGVSQVWLQVRDDNPAACQLYRSVGFVDVVTRTTWRIQPNQLVTLEGNFYRDLNIKHRRKEDWVKQKRLLLERYPLAIRWNLSVDFSRFEPGFIQGLSNLLDGVHLRHWRVAVKGDTQCFITWQKTDSFANNLWLAFPEMMEEKFLPGMLKLILNRLNKKRAISIDFPEGQFVAGFTAIGFRKFRSLIWMKQTLK